MFKIGQKIITSDWGREIAATITGIGRGGDIVFIRTESGSDTWRHAQSCKPA